LKAVAAFLGRNGKCVAGSQVGDVSAQRIKLEAKLRQALEPQWSGLFPQPIAAASQEEKNKAIGGTTWILNLHCKQIARDGRWSVSSVLPQRRI
jgi:hypothetical protein